MVIHICNENPSTIITITVLNVVDRRTEGKEQYYYYCSILLNRRTGGRKHSKWRTISLW